MRVLGPERQGFTGQKLNTLVELCKKACLSHMVLYLPFLFCGCLSIQCRLQYYYPIRLLSSVILYCLGSTSICLLMAFNMSIFLFGKTLWSLEEVSVSEIPTKKKNIHNWFFISTAVSEVT